MLVKRDDRWGFVDRTGRVIVRPVYSFSYGFSCACAAVQDSPRRVYRYIDRDGSALFDTTYDDAYNFVLDRAPVKQGEESAWIDRTGKVVFKWRENSVLPAPPP